MMCRNYQVGDGHWRIVFILYRHLRFTVWIKTLNDPLLPYLGQTPGETMSKIDRRWHQLRIHVVEPRFFGGIAEHHALVAGTLLFKQPLTSRNTLGNVRALRFQVNINLARVSTKAN